MDILFIVPTDKPKLSQEVNGTLLLATKLLDAGFSVDILRFCQMENFDKDYAAFIQEITNNILSIAPKCVSFYSIWPSFHIVLRIAAHVKQANPNIFVAIGGPLISLYPENIMKKIPWVDYVCTGEGENTIIPFARMLFCGETKESVPGLYYREGAEIRHNEAVENLCDLNTLPFWDLRLIPPSYKGKAELSDSNYYMPIDAGRGCPYNCTFCCTSRFWLRTYRLKSPERILQEIKFFQNEFGIRSFMFSHDAFTANRQLVENVCDKILAEGLDITWNCATRADCVTKELLLKMKRSGMQHIQLGVESGSARMQKLIRKNLNLDVVRDVVSFLLENRVGVTLFFIYGLPGETEDDLQKTVEMVLSFIDQGVSHITMSFCNFSPATQITVDCFDDLVFDPAITVSDRCDFGYTEERDLIRENKDVFPFYYHLSTPLRNRYLFLNCFVEAYQRAPKLAAKLRKLYSGDDLAFYRDFVDGNRRYFVEDMHTAMGVVKADPIKMFMGAVDGSSHPQKKQVHAFLEFLRDQKKVLAGENGASVVKTYEFSYPDYMKNRDFSAFAPGWTKVKLQKKDGKVAVSMLDFG